MPVPVTVPDPPPPDPFAAAVILPSSSTVILAFVYAAGVTDVLASSVAPTTPVPSCKLLYGPDTSPPAAVLVHSPVLVTYCSTSPLEGDKAETSCSSSSS